MSVKLVEPNVYLVGRQTIDENAVAAFLVDEGVESWETDTDVIGEKLIEIGGRLCYSSFARMRPGGNKAYIDHILESSHGSVVEHSIFNLIINGVPRSFTHELVRHRAGFSYSELSQRFVDESDCKFVVPPLLRDEVNAALDYLARYGDGCSLVGGISARSVLNEIDGAHGGGSLPRIMPSATELVGLEWIAHPQESLRRYKFLSDHLVSKLVPVLGLDATSRRKQAREAARSVLPECTETKIFVTSNVRALRHFIEMRASLAADALMREVALLVLGILRTESPNLFGDFEVKTSDDGREYAVAKWHKV